MKKLIGLEMERFSLKPHLIGLLIANIAVFLLCVMVSTFLKALGGVMAAAGLPDFSLTTVSLSSMLMRAVLIVWQGTLLAKLIVEEYQTKTIGLLMTYPVNLKQIIGAKLTLICAMLLLFHVVDSFESDAAGRGNAPSLHHCDSRFFRGHRRFFLQFTGAYGGTAVSSNHRRRIGGSRIYHST